MSPTLMVLGVYRLDVTPEIFAGPLPKCRLRHRREVQPVRFSQPNPNYPHGSPQVPWDESLLSSDGEVLLARSFNCATGQAPLRFAFYIHFRNPDPPLRWTYGEVSCPAPQPMPVRLGAA